MTLFNLNYLLKGPDFKYCHIGGSEPQHMNWGDTVQSITPGDSVKSTSGEINRKINI